MTSPVTNAQWDKAAIAYIEQHPDNIAWTQILFPCLQGVINDMQIGTAYDAGCGYGVLSRYLGERGVAVTGVDRSEIMLAKARELNPDIKFVQGDIESDSSCVAAESVDAVFCINVLQDIELYQTALRSFSKALKPGGTCVIAIEHPIWTSKYVTEKGYFREATFVSNFLGQDNPVQGWHRSLSAYWSAAKEAGLNVLRVIEPSPVTPEHDTLMRSRLQQAGMLDQPVFMVFVLKKAA